MPSFSKFASVSALSFSLVAGAELPVRNIVIYKNGVALFERSGTVPAGEPARLEFRTGDMNDILKSLTIVDSTGQRVNSVRYDSNETLSQRLRDTPFAIGSGQLLSQFLDGLRGAPIEIKTGDRTINGSILSARAISSAAGEKAVQREQVTLVTASAELVTIDLGAIASLSFQEPRLQAQLKEYLRIVNDSRAHDKRSLYVDSSGQGAQNLQVSYVLPAAIWKSSYRLTLDDARSTIEGWAIVDNTTDEDWNKVKLAVVSGRPVSFISQLDTPRYGNRPTVELPDDAAAGPVVYGGGVAGGVIGTFPGVESRAAPIPPAMNSIQAPPPAQARQPARAVQTRMADKLSSVRLGESGAVGELFEYRFDQPITIKRNQSALIPFLQDRINARKLLIFDDSGSEHPVNAAELTNRTGRTLDGGPLTVYAQGTYAGEALVETLKAGDKRLIGYAVDYGTRVTTAFDSGTQVAREIHGGEGVLRIRYASRDTRTYTINNVDAKAKTLVLQQEGVADYNVVSPKPSERTASAYRFELPLASNQSKTFKVEQERVYSDTVEVTNASPDFLLTLIQNKQLSDAGRKQLQELVDLKRRLVETTASQRAAQGQITELTADQTRVRQNIDSLNRVSGQEQQVRQYSAQLGSNETQLVQLRDRQSTLAQQKAALEADVRKAIDRLEF